MIDPSLLAPVYALADTVATPPGVTVHDLWSIQSGISLATLAALEIVLGIDNVIFIAILAGRLPAAQQPRARRLGISLAVITRILLLLSITWVMGLTRPLFELFGQAISGKQLILVGGGLFLIGKATFEIHDKLEGADHAATAAAAGATLAGVIVQIMLIDVVFSLDSVITAVGMVDQIGVMIAAVVTSVAVMLFAAKPIGDFVDAHPSVKVLALAFLVMVGMALTAEAFDAHVPKGYIYAAMSFSLVVEFLNIRARKKRLALQAASQA